MFAHRCLSALAFVAIAGSVAAAPIDTTGATFGGSASSFGEPDTATYGQTFTATAGSTQLNSFTFRFNDFDPATVDFAAYVYAWDGSKAAGPQLFASGQLTSTNNGGADGYEVFGVNTGGIQLTAGQQYVAFFSASLFFDGSAGGSVWELSISDVYAGGNFVFNNNGSNFNSLTTQAWGCGNNGCGSLDAWFRADLSDGNAVPEAPSWSLALAALAALGAARRRRER